MTSRASQFKLSPRAPGLLVMLLLRDFSNARENWGTSASDESMKVEACGVQKLLLSVGFWARESLKLIWGILVQWHCTVRSIQHKSLRTNQEISAPHLIFPWWLDWNFNNDDEVSDEEDEEEEDEERRMRRMRRRMRMMRMVMIMMRMIILRIIITMVLASRWESGNNGPSHLLIFTSNMNIRGKLRCAGSSTCFYILCLLLLLCLSSRDL